MRCCNEEVEDVFFDSLDYITRTSSFDSDDSEERGWSGNAVDFDFVSERFGYEVWRNEPRSIKERRERFLREMGFSAGPLSQEIEEDAAARRVGSRRIPDTERLNENSGAVLRMDNVGERVETSSNCRNSVSSEVSSRSSNSGWSNASTVDSPTVDTVYSIRDLDNGKEFIVYELGEDGFLTTLKEVGSDRLITMQEFETSLGLSHSVQRFMQREVSAHGARFDGGLVVVEKKRKSWWRSLRGFGICKSNDSVRELQIPVRSKPVPVLAQRMKVQHQRKKCKEFSAVYMGQEIQAHKGLIWMMKFSPDGKYLASAGEDGVVHVWHVTHFRKEEWVSIPETDAHCKHFTAKSYPVPPPPCDDKMKEGHYKRGRKGANSASVVIPHKIFKISEKPVHEFHGHTGGVLDLSWSRSNCLLSSSKDKTVRLWQVGSNKCLKVFHHNNYVTCIQFNPIDDRYFISGSIDGKIRIWGISECQVVDWADIREIVTAICYRPDGQGCIVGSITGNCRFYEASGNRLQLDAQVCVQGGKKSSGKRITGFQFFPDDSQRVMITSADSQVRIFDGVEVVHKYRGHRSSGSQMFASFTSNGRYIVSASEDSHVYIWNYDGYDIPSSKWVKSIRSCEYFFSNGVSLAIPWSGIEPERTSSGNETQHHLLQQPENLQASWMRDSDCFSLGNGFFADGHSKCSATWLEEKLPPWNPAIEEGCHQHPGLVATWGLVVVTASQDGVIKTFHNFGFPIRLRGLCSPHNEKLQMEAVSSPENAPYKLLERLRFNLAGQSSCDHISKRGYVRVAVLTSRCCRLYMSLA